MREVIKLTRWYECLPFTVPVTLLGGLMAYRLADGNVTLDIRLLYVLLGNCLAVAYAFMINDIEDSEDDQHDPERGKRNVIAAGGISKQTGWIAAFVVAGLAVVVYALAGKWALINGIAILVLAHLYSWKPVRLKALPIVDIVSHVLMLAALLLLSAYMIYDSTLREIEFWLIITSMTLISAYGQFYNQLRDYESDRAAGLRNTASVIGKKATQLVSYLSVIIAVLCLLATILGGMFPLWLLLVIIVALPLVLFVAQGKDMRGDKTLDMLGDVQIQVLLVSNIVLIAWLIAVLINP